jgi:hypothetical protein
VPREDRILAAVNAGLADAWSCWLTRRLALAVLERAPDYVVRTSDLAPRAPAELRRELAAFERDAGLAGTAAAMSVTPPAVLQAGAADAELAERLSIAKQGDRFRLELSGSRGEGAAGIVKRGELERIVSMLQGEVIKAGWLNAPKAPPGAPTATGAADPKSARH